MLKLLHIYTALPCSNAEVERGFSAMNRIKTDLKNRLSVCRLEDLLMISLNGPEINEWNVDEVYKYWKATCNPRNLDV